MPYKLMKNKIIVMDKLKKILIIVQNCQVYINLHQTGLYLHIKRIHLSLKRIVNQDFQKIISKIIPQTVILTQALENIQAFRVFPFTLKIDQIYLKIMILYKK